MATGTGKLSAQESLAIITNMINEAKSHLQKNSFYFLLWGWTVMLANLGMFLLLQLGYPHFYMAWAITVPAWILTMTRMIIKGKQHHTRTHFDSVTTWLWISFSVITFTLVMFGWKINYQLNPVILLVTAIPTMASGAILKFKPLIAGGIFFWIAGVISFMMPMPLQPLIGAVAIMGGYLIPGYLLRKQ